MSTLLQDKAECATLTATFAYYVDRRMYREVADLFTEDGSFGRPGLALRGRTDLYEAMAKRPTTIETRHICTAPVFLSISDTEAEAVSYFTMYQATAVETGTAVCDTPAVVGEYRDSFVKTAEGWRIASRQTVPGMLHKASA